MSSVSGYKCDYCDKMISEDDEGIWVRSSSPGRISIGKSNKKGKGFERLDFCSTDHMIKFINEKLSDENGEQ